MCDRAAQRPPFFYDTGSPQRSDLEIWPSWYSWVHEQGSSSHTGTGQMKTAWQNIPGWVVYMPFRNQNKHLIKNFSISGPFARMPTIILFQSLLYKSNCFTHSSSPSEGAASSISMGINLPLDGCSGVLFFFLLTLLRITLAKSFMSSFCVDCKDFAEKLIPNYL